MFNFFRKRTIKEDPILKEMNRQTEELKAISHSLRKNNESTKAAIQKTEALLLSMGYTQKELDKIKRESKLKVIK